MRLHLMEFEDQHWFPDALRRGMTDYLRVLFNAIDLYQPVAEVIRDGMQQTGDEVVVDICSGGGGNIEKVHARLQVITQKNVRVVLTDKYPNREAFDLLHRKTGGRIDHAKEPVDASDVPSHLGGFRVMFSAMHHFRPQQVKAILRNAADANAGIAVFDGGDKHLLTVIGILLLHPIGFLLLTPFFRPFRLSRLLFTYVLPLTPLFTIFDGVVSIIRLYTPAGLLRIAQETVPDYEWRAGKLRNKLGLRVTYLTGYPAKKEGIL